MAVSFTAAVSYLPYIFAPYRLCCYRFAHLYPFVLTRLHLLFLACFAGNQPARLRPDALVSPHFQTENGSLSGKLLVGVWARVVNIVLVQSTVPNRVL